MAATVAVFNASQQAIAVSVNQGPQFTVPATGPVYAWAPQTQAFGAGPSYGPGYPGLNQLGSGAPNTVQVSVGGYPVGGGPFTFYLPAAYPIISVQIYIFFSPAQGADPSPAAATVGEFRELIAGVRALVEQAAGDLSETGALQLEQIERVARAQALTNALLGETFGAAWSARDFVIRYLVEVDMLGRDKQPDDVDEIVRKEKLVLRDEAGGAIGSLEEESGVPVGMRITLSDVLL